MKSNGLLDASAPKVAEGARLAWLAAKTGRDDRIVRPRAAAWPFPAIARAGHSPTVAVPPENA